MTDEKKLSERMKNAKIVTSGALKVDPQDQNVIWIDAHLDLWIPDVEALEAERDDLLISNERIGLMYSVEDYKKLEAENQQLKEQVVNLEKWERINRTTKQEWGIQLNKAEAEVERLTNLVADEKELWYQKAVKAEAEVKTLRDRVPNLEHLTRVWQSMYEERNADYLRVIKEKVDAKTRLAKAQSRLDITESILGELYVEADDCELFKKYCKLCAENDDCEWGDNFPHCFVEVKSVE